MSKFVILHKKKDTLNSIVLYNESDKTVFLHAGLLLFIPGKSVQTGNF